MIMSIFCSRRRSNRVEWKQERAIRRSRIVVVSQSDSNRNFDHFRRKPISQLRFGYDTTTIDYDTTAIRRCHDAFDYDGSDRNYDLRSIRLRYNYDMTTTKN